VTGSWDPDRLAEALSNIAGNAVEHAAPGTAVVVKAHADGPEVVVEIINHGDPIPGDVLPFIFEPFRRAEQGRKSAAGNLGLGLYIARQIVRAGGGTLAAYSAEGTTTFLMRLPRHAPSAELTRQMGTRRFGRTRRARPDPDWLRRVRVDIHTPGCAAWRFEGEGRR